MLYAELWVSLGKEEPATICTATGQLKLVIVDIPILHDFTQPESLSTGLVMGPQIIHELG